MTLAVFGGSCTGKTTFVKYIARRYDFPVRHCGDAIRVAADVEGVELLELGIEAHIGVDQETVRWAQMQKSPKIVEGRFLNFVLTGLARTVTLVHFVSSTEARSKRLRTHNTASEALQAILRADSLDLEFCRQLYKGVLPLAADITIDTSCLSLREIEDQLVGALK